MSTAKLHAKQQPFLLHHWRQLVFYQILLLLESLEFIASLAIGRDWANSAPSDSRNSQIDQPWGQQAFILS
jgi:hypothetical protein